MATKSTNRHYTITLVNGTNGEASSAVAKSETATENAEEEQKEEKSPIKAMVVYSAAKRLVNTFVAESINTIELRTGQQELAQKQQFAYDIGQKVFNFGESIAIGAATGGAIGAVVGGLFSVLMTGIQIAQAQNRINMKRDLENISIKQANIRAGAGMSRNMAFDNP